MARSSFRLVPLAIALALAPAVAGCAPKMKAMTEFAEEADFAGYKTYRWLTDDLVLIQSGTGNERIRNVENEKRIRAAVDRELGTKGLTKSEDEADLVVAFTVGTKVRYRLEGGDQFSVVSGGPGGTVTRGTLTLYFFDPQANEQVWEAWTSKDLDGTQDPDTVINNAVGLLMAQFPPSNESG